jgi:hypothetical protein
LFHEVHGDLDKAVEDYSEAVRLNPGSADAHNNLGNVLRKQGKHTSALQCFQKALIHMPNHPWAHFNRALTQLLLGDFLNGWPDYEWRFAVRDCHQEFIRPKWDGSFLEGKTILVYTEQGFGDTIQFARYLPLIKTRGGSIVFACQPELVNLFNGHDYIDTLIEKPKDGYENVSFEVQIPLLSLPGIFNTTVDDIPNAVPYIEPDPENMHAWGSKMEVDKCCVGLVWSSGPSDRKRDCDPGVFSPLASIPGVVFCSLQQGHSVKSTQGLPVDMELIDFSNSLQNFSDTAALVAHLDLVITVDTAVAHLAGAMAKPVWTLLPYSPDWRWLLNREDSPWYPTMQLFRQESPGDWIPVVEKVAQKLKSFARRHSHA